MHRSLAEPDDRWMNTPTATAPTVTADRYALGRSANEYQRVRQQALAWEPATTALLDRLGVHPGASCLDAGSGPGEIMRVLADRVGPTGRVLGIDVDSELSGIALARLHEDGYQQCAIDVRPLRGDEPVPGGPFDLVFARLLLFHLPERAAALARLWEAVAPGGCLIIQEYNVRSALTEPVLPAFEQVKDLIMDAFRSAGADPGLGARLPLLFDEAGIGSPDGTDVAGLLMPLSRGRGMVLDTARSLLPVALGAALVTAESAELMLTSADQEVEEHPDYQMLWPLLIGAWKYRDRT
jgi:SAM-dependent methyltransferase